MKPKFGPASKKQRHPVHPQHDNVYLDPLNMGTNEHTEGSADKRTNQKELVCTTANPAPCGYVLYIYIIQREREKERKREIWSESKVPKKSWVRIVSPAKMATAWQ